MKGEDIFRDVYTVYLRTEKRPCHNHIDTEGQDLQRGRNYSGIEEGIGGGRGLGETAGDTEPTVLFKKSRSELDKSKRNKSEREGR